MLIEIIPAANVRGAACCAISILVRGPQPERTGEPQGCAYCANTQFRKWDLFRMGAPYALGGIREQGGKRVERPARLENSSHFEPVTKDHDRNQ